MVHDRCYDSCGIKWGDASRLTLGWLPAELRAMLRCLCVLYQSGLRPELRGANYFKCPDHHEYFWSVGLHFGARMVLSTCLSMGSLNAVGLVDRR